MQVRIVVWPPGWLITSTPSAKPAGHPAEPVAPLGPVAPGGPGGPGGPGSPLGPVATLIVVVTVAWDAPLRAWLAAKPEPAARSRLVRAINVVFTDLDPLLQRSNTLLALLVGALPLGAPVPHHRDRRADGRAEGSDGGCLVRAHSCREHEVDVVGVAADLPLHHLPVLHVTPGGVVEGLGEQPRVGQRVVVDLHRVGVRGHVDG